MYYLTEFLLSYYSLYQLITNSVVKNGCRITSLRWNRGSGRRRGVLTRAGMLAELGRENGIRNICICSRRLIAGFLHAFWREVCCTPVMLSLCNVEIKWMLSSYSDGLCDYWFVINCIIDGKLATPTLSMILTSAVVCFPRILTFSLALIPDNRRKASV